MVCPILDTRYERKGYSRVWVAHPCIIRLVRYQRRSRNIEWPIPIDKGNMRATWSQLSQSCGPKVRPAQIRSRRPDTDMIFGLAGSADFYGP